MTTELAVPKGHGLVRIAHNLRVHVPATLWQSEAATDFWVLALSADPVTASGATNLSGLDSYGWVTNNLSIIAADGGTFLDPTDVATTAIDFGATGDRLQSPYMFGDYSHGLLAGQILGHLPTRLIVEVYAAFTTHSSDENRTGFGLVKATGSGATAADQVAWIYTDNTNFQLRSSADSDAGDTDDGDFHQFRIVVSKGTTDAVEWFIDGTSQGTMDLEIDKCPWAFACHTLTNNRISLAWAHLWYE
jgi:hypothetical protein